MKNLIDNNGNPTYKWDDVGFLLANFWHFLHEFDEPFVFLSQVQQVFFWSDTKTPFWKIILHKEPSSQQVMANMYDGCLETHRKAFGLEIPLDFVDVDRNRTLVYAIELSREDAFLVTQALKGSLGLDDAT